MDRTDRNVLRLSGRLRALERVMTVMLIDWAKRGDGDSIQRIDAARRNTIIGLQLIDRPIDEATEFEWREMVDVLEELFAGARAELEKLQSED